MWWNNKVGYVKARNCDEKLNTDFTENQVTHTMLSLAVEHMHSADAFERSQYIHDIDFIDNVQRVLRLTRLLSFSVNAYDKRTLEEQ